MPIRPTVLPAFAVFAAAARHQNFAHAAEELHLAQSALSHQIRRLEEVVQGFLKFTRPEDLRLQPVSVTTLFEEIVPVIEPEARAGNVKVILESPASLPDVHGDGAMLRQAQAIGAKVTLRGEHMYEFLERLIKASLPRIRDFRGVSPKGFDGHGNYTLGVSDQAIFPEVELDKIKRNIGFDVTIVTTAQTDEEAKSLLSEMGMPFSDRAKKVATATASEGAPAATAPAA